MSYKKTHDYEEYLQGGTNRKRHPALPPYKTNERGELQVSAGEVYCRFKDHHGWCNHVEAFSNESNCRSHIKKHNVPLKSRTTGALSVVENQETRDFYSRLMTRIRRYNERAANNEEELDDEDANAIPFDTPSKNKPPAIRTPKKKELLDLPTWQQGGKQFVTISKLKKHALMTGSCTPCVQKKRKCPTKTRTNCEVWAKFKVNDAIEKNIAQPKHITKPKNRPPAGGPSSPISIQSNNAPGRPTTRQEVEKEYEEIKNRFKSNHNLTKEDFASQVQSLREDNEALVSGSLIDPKTWEIDSEWTNIELLRQVGQDIKALERVD